MTYTLAGVVSLFLWLLAGDFAWMMKERAITPVAQIMLRSFESPDWLVGLLVGSIPAGIGMILGPVVSVCSDRHRGRWGRRIPYLFIPTPFVALAMFGLAVTPALGEWLHQALGEHSPGLMGTRILVFTFFWTAFEIGSIIVNTLFIALINDVVPKQVIGRFFALFRAVSLIAGILFNFFLMGKAQAHTIEIFGVLGLFYGIGFTLMCLKVKEGEYPPPEPVERVSRKGKRLEPLVRYLRECFTHRYYLCFFLAFTLGMIANAPVNAFSIFHARSVGMSDDLYGKCLALSYVISLILTYPLGSLADRFHPIRVGLWATIIYAGVTLAGFVLPNEGNVFFVTFLLHTVISGIYLTGTASLAPRLLPQAKFAQFASAASLVTAGCVMVLPPMLGTFIQVMGHQYRYAFLLGFLISAGSAGAYVLLLRGFYRHGGDANYEPPIPEAENEGLNR
ncbi:MFS transporter [Ruficoccus amylovorans]|uniref:MFS transporter n=1 Tax=Ruficoccus amylovorans TaxID=1804625 RepID=UPI001C8C4912|nr:MFS transporter [Ruficoccus amylovorans]